MDLSQVDSQLKLPLTWSPPVLQSLRPPSWARGGHRQTLVGHFWPSPALPHQGERVEIPLAGGDRAVARFFAGTSSSVIYLFHGLGGSSQSTYIQRIARLALARGHSVFMGNHRGCGDGVGLAREPYHSGRAEDLSALIAYGRSRYPERKHLAIGFSLSANALLLLVAKQRAEILPDAAIAVNAPINLALSARLLTQGLNRIYDFDFMREMRRGLKERSELDRTLKNIRMPLHMTLTEFDDLYTAPYGGFKNRYDYYESCSAAPHLKDVSVPTVAITAENDPFVGAADYRAPHGSPHLHVHIENDGGHMGYFSDKATPLGSRRWLDYAVATYMDSLLEHVEV